MGSKSKVLKQLYWGLAFAAPFTIWAIFDTYQNHIEPIGNIMPKAPNTGQDMRFDFKTDQWVPLRKEPQTKSLDEKVIERAKGISFDSLQYDPEFDPLYEPEINH